MKVRLIVLMLIAAATIAVPAGAAVAAESDGCAALNGSNFDGLAFSGGVSGPTFAAGDELIMTAGLPWTVGPPTATTLTVNFAVVGTDGYPGTVGYIIPADGAYTVGWVANGGNAMWDVRCLSADGGDADADGVADADDICEDTILPDEPTNGLKGKRFAAQTDGIFDSGDGSLDALYSIADTAGCSGTQIIASEGLKGAHGKFGISQRALEAFIASVSAG